MSRPGSRRRDGTETDAGRGDAGGDSGAEGQDGRFRRLRNRWWRFLAWWDTCWFNAPHLYWPFREWREARARPPQRFRLLGRWYHLESVSGHAWNRHADPHGPITYRYLPEDRP